MGAQTPPRAQALPGSGTECLRTMGGRPVALIERRHLRSALRFVSACLLSMALACASPTPESEAEDRVTEDKQTLVIEGAVIAYIIFVAVTGYTLYRVVEHSGKLRAVPTAQSDILSTLSRLLLHNFTVSTVTTNAAFSERMRELERQHGNGQPPPVGGEKSEELCYNAQTWRNEAFFKGKPELNEQKEMEYEGSFTAKTRDLAFSPPSRVASRVATRGCEEISGFYGHPNWEVSRRCGYDLETFITTGKECASEGVNLHYELKVFNVTRDRKTGKREAEKTVSGVIPNAQLYYD